MLSKILGVISVLAGLLWLIKPDFLKNRLKKKINRKIKFIVYGFVIIFGFLLIGSALKAEGLYLKLIGIIGMIVVIKGIMLITSKTSEKILDWLAEKPLYFFRIWALFIILLGVMLIMA